MKHLIVAVAALVLMACGATVGQNARSDVSKFDGSRNVWIDQHGTNCGMSMTCSDVGAAWTSADPNHVVLRIGTMGAYESISAAALNIDGRIITLQPVEAFTHLGHAGGVASYDTYSPANQEALRTSERGFLVPMEIIREILASKSVKLRVQTSEMTIDSVVIDGSKDSKAFYALQRFMLKVQQVGT